MSKRVLFLLLLILTSLSAAGCGFGEIKAEGKEDQKIHYYLTPTPMGQGSAEAVTTSLKTCDIEQVRLLMASYYSALKNADSAQLAQTVLDPAAIDDKVFLKWEGVRGVSIKHVYMLEGSPPIDYIVYVYYELKIEGTEKTIPSLDELYIVKNNDEYRVINGSISATAYNNVQSIINSEPGVNELVNSVNLLFAEAVDSDETVKSFVNEKKIS